MPYKCKAKRHLWLRGRKAKVKRIIRNYKLKKGCNYCGYRKNWRALDMDHIDPLEKKYNFSTQAHRFVSFDELHEEMKKCQVLCANCHRIKTHVNQDWKRKDWSGQR